VTSRRRTLAATRAALAAAAAMFALSAQAQPVGRYWGWNDYGYRYEPPIAYGPDGEDTGVRYFNGYDGFNASPKLAPPPIQAWKPALPAPTPGAVNRSSPTGGGGPKGRRGLKPTELSGLQPPRPLRGSSP